jgi:CRP-like cAMP-binding protein
MERDVMPENLLLASLPEKERKRLEPFLRSADLQDGMVLISPEEPIEHVYFPETCVTSTLQELSNGSTVEAGLMGVEGMVGIQLWLHERQTPSKTLVQVSGRVRRMDAEDFIREVMETNSPLNGLVARYTHAFLVMTSQVAACNRLHEVEPRLCRWLKMIHNRVDRDEFGLRQDFIAEMLGVHRPTVSIAAKSLQKAGFIDYTRGQMRILDPKGLEKAACECYSLIERQVARLRTPEVLAEEGIAD